MIDQDTDAPLAHGPIQACKTFEEFARVLSPYLQFYSKKDSFHGEVAILTVFDGTKELDEKLATSVRGRVVLINAHCQVDVSFYGKDQHALAVKGGARAVVVFGAVQNVATLRKSEMAVLALGNSPRLARDDIGITRGGYIRAESGRISSADYIVGNRDGVVVVEKALYEKRFDVTSR